jgi:hypothetical protein
VAVALQLLLVAVVAVAAIELAQEHQVGGLLQKLLLALQFPLITPLRLGQGATELQQTALTVSLVLIVCFLALHQQVVVWVST